MYWLLYHNKGGKRTDMIYIGFIYHKNLHFNRHVKSFYIQCIYGVFVKQLKLILSDWVMVGQRDITSLLLDNITFFPGLHVHSNVKVITF